MSFVISLLPCGRHTLLNGFLLCSSACFSNYWTVKAPTLSPLCLADLPVADVVTADCVVAPTGVNATLAAAPVKDGEPTAKVANVDPEPGVILADPV